MAKQPQPVQKQPQILSAAEADSLKSEKHEIETTLRQIDGEAFGRGTAAEGIDKAALQGQIKRIDHALHVGTAPKVNSVGKDRLAQEARSLEDKIKRNMPTQSEMDFPRKHPGAIRKNQMWERDNRQNIERWKQVQRTLEHGDPTASNVERLRSR